MTERSARHLSRDATSFAVARSSLRWDGSAFLLDIDEIAAPIPRRVKGRVRIVPKSLNTRSFVLDGAGRHRWMPLAPTAHVELAFDSPGVAWTGHGYVDTNAGDEPMPAGFRSWDWSRADVGTDCVTLYDTVGRDGERRSFATRFRPDGTADDIEPPPRIALPRTRWLLPRGTQADAGEPVRVMATLEDTPFYARSMLDTSLTGSRCIGMHESIDLDRLDTGIVRAMLPFRMPRLA
jgi:carotenoid 1,2-hydratase